MSAPSPDPRQQPQTAPALARRLTEGWDRIEEAIARGEDVTAWESFWIDLLRRYEERYDIEEEVRS
jgi:hypothetical protein